MADVKELNINNTTYDIKAKSVVDTNSGSVKFWTGTQAEYEAVSRTWYAWRTGYNGNIVYTSVPYDENVNPDVYDSNFDLIDPGEEVNEFANDNLWYYTPLDVGYNALRYLAGDVFTDANKNTIYICTDTGRIYYENIIIENSIDNAHNAMPSYTSTALTIGANGATYTAPADGWIYARATATMAAAYVWCNAGLGNQVFYAPANGYECSIFQPIQKGRSFTFGWGGANPIELIFVYAVGSESEAS